MDREFQVPWYPHRHLPPFVEYYLSIVILQMPVAKLYPCTLTQYRYPSRHKFCLNYLAFCYLPHDSCMLCWLRIFFTQPWDRLFVPTLGTLTLYWLHGLLASHPIRTMSLRLCIHVTWWNCCIIWSFSSNAHSNVINQHCRALPVLCCALIVLVFMISGNVHLHPGPFTVTSPNFDFLLDVILTNNPDRY